MEDVSYQVLYGVAKLTKEMEKVSGDNYICRQEEAGRFVTVSYTHLDVYKRQVSSGAVISSVNQGGTAEAFRSLLQGWKVFFYVFFK